MNEGGEVWVVDARSDKLDVLTNQANFGADSSTASRSSIAIADGQVFIRTADKLYCISGK
jgi:hypothetical protein